MADYPITKYNGDGYTLKPMRSDEFNKYRDEQLELQRIVSERLVSNGRKPLSTCPADFFARYALVPRNDGTVSIVTRSRVIDVIEYDAKGNSMTIHNVQRTYSERMRLGVMNGKYRDEDELYARDGFKEEFKVGEVTSMTSF